MCGPELRRYQMVQLIFNQLTISQRKRRKGGGGPEGAWRGPEGGGHVVTLDYKGPIQIMLMTIC